MLTERQQQILDYVKLHWRTHGVMPSLREIQQHFRLGSVATVAQHIDALESKQMLRREAGRARSLALPSATRHRVIELPILGSIPAGLPAANEALADGQLAVDPAVFGLRPEEPAYTLRVRGDSMTGAGIEDGDLVVLACRPAKHRDIVGALVDGEATLKRLLTRPRPVLMPENPKYRPIPVTENLLIQGVYLGHVRVHR